MRPILVTAVVTLLAAASTPAAEVFVTRDAQGRPIYTDRPESLPAAKVNVATQKTDLVEVQRREAQAEQGQAAEQTAAEAAKKAADARQARELSATDKAKRCQEARGNYQNLMTARRIYEPGSTPEERRYLDSGEMDAARADAKKLMDDLCAGQ